jgi:hypothetical protein
MVHWSVNRELGRIWKDVIITYFKVGLLPQHVPGGTDEYHMTSVNMCSSALKVEAALSPET